MADPAPPSVPQSPTPAGSATATPTPPPPPAAAAAAPATPPAVSPAVPAATPATPAGTPAAEPPAVESSSSGIRFPDLAPLVAWGTALADNVVAVVDAAELVLTQFGARQQAVRKAVSEGSEPPRGGALTPYRETLVGQMVAERLQGQVKRLQVLLHIVHLCAPRRKSPGEQRSRQLANDSVVVTTSTNEGAPPSEPLWRLVARHVKHDLATVATHLQLDTAILHSAMLPLHTSDTTAVAAALRAGTEGRGRDSVSAAGRTPLIVDDDSALSAADASLVDAVSAAFQLHPNEYLAFCQDALEVAVATADARVHLEAKTNGAVSGYAGSPSRHRDGDITTIVPASVLLSLPMTPKSLSDGHADVRIDEQPEASISEENTVYARVLQRQAQTSGAPLMSLGAAVSRVEGLSRGQVDAMNSGLADAVVSTFHLYNVLVAVFQDYQREAGQYHRVRAACEGLTRLRDAHLESSKLPRAARDIALLVGEVVAATDAASEALAGLRKWSALAVDATLPTGDSDEGLVSEVAFRRTVRLARAVPQYALELTELAGHLQALCEQCLLEHCEPMTAAIQQTLDGHASALLPLAQALASVTSDLRTVDATLGRELGHMRQRCADGSPADDVARWLLLRTADGVSSTVENEGGNSAVRDPLTNAHLIDVAACQRRIDVVAAVVHNIKNAVMQVPPSLSGILRVAAQPAHLRPSSSRTLGVNASDDVHAAGGLRASVADEVAQLEATLSDARASLNKHRAAVRAADAMQAASQHDGGAAGASTSSAAGLTTSAAALQAGQMTYEGVRLQIHQAIRETMLPSNSAAHASTIGAPSGGGGTVSPRRLGGLTSDQSIAVDTVRAMVDFAESVEGRVLRLAAKGFAADGDEGLAEAQRDFIVLVGFTESMGQALYLDIEKLRRVGAASAHMERGANFSTGL